MTVETTPRDRAWIDVIQHSLTTGKAIKSSQIEERTNVSRDTARVVLQAAANADSSLLDHEEGEHWYYPRLAFVTRFEDDDLRRLFRDVIADDRADQQEMSSDER